MENEFKYDMYLYDWKYTDNSPFEAYMRKGTTFFYSLGFTELGEIRQSLKEQYTSGKAMQVITMFGQPTRIIICGEGVE